MKVPAYILGPLSWKAAFCRKGQGSPVGTQAEDRTFMTKKASGIHGWIRQRTASRSREMDPCPQGLLSTGKATPGVLHSGLGPQYRDVSPQWKASNEGPER